jgi:hypothetical protein
MNVNCFYLSSSASGINFDYINLTAASRNLWLEVGGTIGKYGMEFANTYCTCTLYSYTLFVRIPIFQKKNFL